MNKIINEYIKLDFLRYKRDYSKVNIIKEFTINKGFTYSFLIRVYKGYNDENKKKRAFSIKLIKKYYLEILL